METRQGLEGRGPSQGRPGAPGAEGSGKDLSFSLLSMGSWTWASPALAFLGWLMLLSPGLLRLHQPSLASPGAPRRAAELLGFCGVSLRGSVSDGTQS